MTKLIPNVTFASLEQVVAPENAAEFIRQLQEYGRERGTEEWLWDLGILVDTRDLSSYRITTKEVGETVREMHPDTSLFIPYLHFFFRFSQRFYAKLGAREDPVE